MGRKNNVNISKEEGVNNSAITEASAETVTDEWVQQKLAPYLDAFPNEMIFYITSDGQVFLERSHNDAVNHQRFYDFTKTVVSFERQ